MYNNVYFDIELQNQLKKGQSISKYGKISVFGTWWDLEDDAFATEYFDLSDHFLAFDCADRIVGYNINNFDFNLLKGYVTKAELKRWKKKSFDMYAYLMTHRYGYRGTMVKVKPGLQDVSVPTLNTPKMNLGMTCPVAWQLGFVDELIEYVKQDVRLAKWIWEFGREHGFILYNGKDRKTRKIKVVW